MNNDGPDTFPESEHTRWQETLAEDVFLPSVRVQLNWRDVEAAVAAGAIVPQQAHALWASWAMPGSSTRLSVDAPQAKGPSNDSAKQTTLESAWVGRPMPEIERPSRLPGILGFVTGALVMMGAVAIYNGFLAG